MWNNRTDLGFSILTKINSYILQSSLRGFFCLFFVYINKRILYFALRLLNGINIFIFKLYFVEQHYKF